MKNELAMRLFSRRCLTVSQAKDQITGLSEFGGGLMCPDRCGEYEPIITPFDPTDLSEPIRWLAQPHGEFLYRKGRPIHASGVMWNLTHTPNANFPSPLFTNYWTGEFDGTWASRIGVDKVIGFVSEMFRMTGADFGLLTSQSDLDAKNYLVTNDGQMSYKGLDPASGIPGLYWINLFSHEFAAWLGLTDLPMNLATCRNLADGGVLLQFGESPTQCGSFEVIRRQIVMVDWLGPEKFFDIRFPDRKLRTPNWNW
jgi:hypothetical protein